MVDKLLFLVDVQNLFYACRDSFGIDTRVDFKKLKELALNAREVRFVNAIAYLTYLKDDFANVLKVLNRFGYETKIRPIQQHGDELSDTDSDMDIAADVLKYADGCQVVVVASGDADFIPLYRVLREKGIRVEVLAFDRTLSRQVINHVDAITLLNENVLFKREIA